MEKASTPEEGRRAEEELALALIGYGSFKDLDHAREAVKRMQAEAEDDDA